MSVRAHNCVYVHTYSNCTADVMRAYMRTFMCVWSAHKHACRRSCLHTQLFAHMRGHTHICMQMHARFMDACQQIGKIARQHCGEQRGNNYAPLHRHVQPLEDVCTQVRACISARVQQACLCAWTRRYASTRM